jgi:hypothetical protein
MLTFFVGLGIEPRALSMLGEHPATEQEALVRHHFHIFLYFYEYIFSIS